VVVQWDLMRHLKCKKLITWEEEIYRPKSDNTVQTIETYVLYVLYMSMIDPFWAWLCHVLPGQWGVAEYPRYIRVSPAVLGYRYACLHGARLLGTYKILGPLLQFPMCGDWDVCLTWTQADQTWREYNTAISSRLVHDGHFHSRDKFVIHCYAHIMPCKTLWEYIMLDVRLLAPWRWYVGCLTVSRLCSRRHLAGCRTLHRDTDGGLETGVGVTRLTLEAYTIL
jgi:hypothetical protein